MGQVTRSFYPSDDTEIKTVPNQNGNYGTRDVMGIGEPNNGDGLFRSLVKFDLSSIPKTATIVSATLHLFGLGDYSNKDVTMYGYRITSGWDESTVAYSTQPSHTAPVIVSWLQPSSFSVGTHFSPTVTTDVVQKWVTGEYSNYGIMLMSSNDPSNNDDLGDYGTKENSNSAYWPYLEIVYNIPNPPQML